MKTEGLTLESLNNELQKLKLQFSDRNVFQDIANHLSGLIEIETSIVPIVGNIVNEGEEFILKQKIGFNPFLNVPSNVLGFDINQFLEKYFVGLIYWDNCTQKLDNAGEKMIIAKDIVGLNIKNYKVGFSIDGTTESKHFFIYDLTDSVERFPIEISYYLIAADNINREKPLVELYFKPYREILFMQDLSKSVIIGNEVIHPG